MASLPAWLSEEQDEAAFSTGCLRPDAAPEAAQAAAARPARATVVDPVALAAAEQRAAAERSASLLARRNPAVPAAPGSAFPAWLAEELDALPAVNPVAYPLDERPWSQTAVSVRHGLAQPLPEVQRTDIRFGRRLAPANAGDEIIVMSRAARGGPPPPPAERRPACPQPAPAAAPDPQARAQPAPAAPPPPAPAAPRPHVAAARSLGGSGAPEEYCLSAVVSSRVASYAPAAKGGWGADMRVPPRAHGRYACSAPCCAPPAAAKLPPLY